MWWGQYASPLTSLAKAGSLQNLLPAKDLLCTTQEHMAWPWVRGVLANKRYNVALAVTLKPSVSRLCVMPCP